jgi:transmembrane sensor
MNETKTRSSAADSTKDDAMGTSVQDSAIEWFVRLRDEPFSPAVGQAFEAWLAADKSHGEAYEEVERLWNGLDHLDFVDMQTENAPEEPAAEESTALLFPKAEGRAPSRKMYRFAYAASILLAVFVGVYTLNNPRFYAEHSTKAGERKIITSADGSTIEMNTASALSVDFSETQRTITLHSGEAYFEVEKDPKRPFIVLAGDVEVRVLGTAFSVERLDSKVDVLVSESSVQVFAPNEESTVVSAGKGVVFTDGRFGALQSIEAKTAMSWRNDRLIFVDLPFDQAAAELDRYLPGTIMMMDEAFEDMRVSGSFSIADPSSVLDMFEQTFPIRVVRLGNFLTLLYLSEKQD